MVLAVFVLSVALSADQQPRDAPPAKPPIGATIAGRVTAAATERPLHRVRITLNGSLPNPLTAVTDAEGAFELLDVPSGSYTLTATRAGYLPIHFGQRRPGERGRTLKVESGERLEHIDIALYKGAVIAGRIADEQGDPLPNSSVEAVELRYIGGRRVPVAARITTTNDAGEYRLSGLAPGAYQVRASTIDLWESDDGKATYVHAITYFPGVLGSEQPQTINVSLGQEAAGIEFRLIAGRAARITGVVEDPAGKPLPDQAVNLDRIERTTGGGLLYAEAGGSIRTDTRGAFTFPALPAGEYMAYSGGPDDRTAVQVFVAPGDHRDVVIRPRKSVVAAGTIVTDDGVAPPPFPASRITIVPLEVDLENVLPRWAAPRPQAATSGWSFRISNMDGKYLFRASGLPDDWMLKAVTLASRDIIDTPLAIVAGSADVTGLQIVLSRKGASASGTVVDVAGSPAPDASVVLFAEDPALWGPGSRYIHAVRPDAEGRFTIGGLPPAVYRIAARDYVPEGQWEDPEFLQALAKNAARVTLAEGAAEVVRLTVGPIR